MKRSQQLFEKIEEYLANTLSQEEQVAFEKEMAMDSELKIEVEKQRELHRVLSDTDTMAFKEKLQKISAEIKQEESKTNSYFSYWKIAASIIILFGLGTLLWNISDSESPEDLYLAYYHPFPAEDHTRGETHNDTKGIIAAYVNGEYSRVIQKLEGLVKSSDQERFKLYLGNSYLNTNQEQKAIFQFQSIRKSSQYYETAKWYKALAYLKIGKKDSAKSILSSIINYKGIYKSKALELSEKLLQ
ncbi:hypothetical protein [Aquimarina sp. RZ0]|uniref:hypothetical protein n=1 Tax=Aquimarina sp. RZ0 TaxID=2607730 RepID=UPI0011F3B49B|nr:hypothetical protein [Aquimarina sp. RZ0]KAA1242491.1 hypothetical protein F0000_25380 [Aquimarina sp. RZ0]